MFQILSEGALRVGLGFLVLAPAALCCFFPTWLALGFATRGSGQRWIARPAAVAALICFIALSIEALAFATIGTPLEQIGRALTVYPGSAIFVVTPDNVWRNIPELWGFFIFSLSALFVSASAVAGFGAVLRAVRGFARTATASQSK